MKNGEEMMEITKKGKSFAKHNAIIFMCWQNQHSVFTMDTHTHQIRVNPYLKVHLRNESGIEVTADPAAFINSGNTITIIRKTISYEGDAILTIESYGRFIAYPSKLHFTF